MRTPGFGGGVQTNVLATTVSMGGTSSSEARLTDKDGNFSPNMSATVGQNMTSVSIMIITHHIEQHEVNPAVSIDDVKDFRSEHTESNSNGTSYTVSMSLTSLTPEVTFDQTAERGETSISYARAHRVIHDAAGRAKSH